MAYVRYHSGNPKRKSSSNVSDSFEETARPKRKNSASIYDQRDINSNAITTNSPYDQIYIYNDTIDKYLPGDHGKEGRRGSRGFNKNKKNDNNNNNDDDAVDDENGKNQTSRRHTTASPHEISKFSDPTSQSSGSKLLSSVDHGGSLVSVDSARLSIPHYLYTKDHSVDMHRLRLITKPTGRTSFSRKSGGVLYWMSREQRVQDNWALIYAQAMSIQMKEPLFVVFSVVSKFLDATIRQYDFMLRGLQEVHNELTHNLSIPFFLLFGSAKDNVPSFVRTYNIRLVVCDMSPLRVTTQWVEDVGAALDQIGVEMVQLDAHNIIPVWVTSDKQEYAARTIRPKIHTHLKDFLVEFPSIVRQEIVDETALETAKHAFDLNEALAHLEVDRDVKELKWCVPGTKGGLSVLEDFCSKKLAQYAALRNNPNKQAVSGLSPWFHFGQISIQRAILKVTAAAAANPSKLMVESRDAFIEEAVVRRELADNLCFYNKNYDNLNGAAQWARSTLKLHAGDKREQIYSLATLEHGETYDDLWNACQLEMTQEGKMHGFMRMYWAKKILEWTSSPEEALRYAIYLNDKYEIDGRDPNGYVGIMWSIAGLHDQGWSERPVFGKIRYMNYKGCQRKFDVPMYIANHVKKGQCKLSLRKSHST